MSADKEPFSERVQIAEKTEKKGTNGIYYALKNEKGLVFNVNEKVCEEHGRVMVGETYLMDGVILPPKPGSGYTKGSRWVNSFTEVDGGKGNIPTNNHQENHQQTQKAETHREKVDTTMPINGAAQGMIINNSVALTIACLGLPGSKTDTVSIKKTVEFWNEYLENMVKTGKLYEPF